MRDPIYYQKKSSGPVLWCSEFIFWQTFYVADCHLLRRDESEHIFLGRRRTHHTQDEPSSELFTLNYTHIVRSGNTKQNFFCHVPKTTTTVYWREQGYKSVAFQAKESRSTKAALSGININLDNDSLLLYSLVTCVWRIPNTWNVCLLESSNWSFLAAVNCHHFLGNYGHF